MGLDNPIHIAFLLILLLLVFGAKRLPEMGRSLGDGMRGFKDAISGESSHAAAPPAAARGRPAGARRRSSSEPVAVPSEIRSAPHPHRREDPRLIMATAVGSIGHEDRLSVVDHLEELRARLIVSLAVVAVAFGFCFWQNHALLNIINRAARARDPETGEGRQRPARRDLHRAAERAHRGDAAAGRRAGARASRQRRLRGDQELARARGADAAAGPSSTCRRRRRATSRSRSGSASRSRRRSGSR